MQEDKIKILPSVVANQIAAGEVVQRPASIVKELMENAVDAGASSIQVVIADGGSNLIQVVDDGMGMSERDAQSAFLRHATSKIRKAEDLFALHTFGFRGEALASIAAVAQVEMRTRRVEDSLATQVIVGGSAPSQVSSVAGAKGTYIVVRNLFFNIPARRKFLKSVAYETRLVVNEFERVALVNPDISFSLRTAPDKAPINLVGGNLHQRIVAIMAKGMGHKLLPLDVDTPVVRLSGYIGTQAAAKKGASEQFFFVNGRYMRNAYMQKAVVRGYGKLIAQDALPTFFIYIEVDPSRIDVNIHPTKSEIKFLDEQVVWQVINSAVRQTLGKHNVVPTLDFSDTTTFDIPVYNRPLGGGSTVQGGVYGGAVRSRPAMGSGREDYNPFKSYDTGSWEQSPLPKSVISTWGGDAERAPFAEVIPPSLVGADFDDPSTLAASATSAVSASAYSGHAMVDSAQEQGFTIIEDFELEARQQELPMEVATSRGVICLANKYFATSTIDGLMVIDYRRALVRIMYERIMAELEGGGSGDGGALAVPIQRLLQPQAVSLSHADHILILENTELLIKLGFEISDMGGCDIGVYGLPTSLSGGSRGSINSASGFSVGGNVDCDVALAIESVLSSIKEQGEDLSQLQSHKAALTVARSYGRGGANLTTEHAHLVLDQLMICQEPSYTPDSLPIIEVITLEELTKRFKK